MAFPIPFKASVARELAKLPREAQLRFLFAFTLLSVSPTKATPRLSVKQMRGHLGFWRIAISPWRGVYQFDGSVIRFYLFGHRSTVYTQFESTR